MDVLGTGLGCHTANRQEATGPPVLAKFTASQGPFVLHHQPVLCRTLEVLAQDMAPPDRTPEPRLPPAAPQPYRGDESQAGFCLMLPLVSCYSFLPWVRDQAREPSLPHSLCVAHCVLPVNAQPCSGGLWQEQETFHSSLLKPLGMLHWGEKNELHSLPGPT